MMHEPFYESGSYLCETLHAGFAWVCHKESFADGQPFWNEKKNICLFFAGECFGLEQLMAEHQPNRSFCDTAESLIYLYEQLGLSVVEKLNGTFSGAIADFRTKQIYLFNDRYGLGRIYYHQAKDAFYFACEAKALLSAFPKLRQLDAIALAEQFSCGCTLQNRTLFSGVSLLPGGSLWTISIDGRTQRGRYFDPGMWENQPVLDEGNYDRQLKATFSEILPSYFRGKSPLGMSLTGGLDGRMIMAYAPVRNGSFPCYTFGGSYRDCADVLIARKVARIRGHSHEVVPVNGRFLKEFPRLAEKSVYLSDGTMDVGGAVELYTNERAREIAPIRLTGNYGSEILRRNVAFRPSQETFRFLSPDFIDLVDEGAATYDRERKVDTLSFIAFKQVPWHHYSRLSLEQSQLTVRSPYLDNKLVCLAYRAPVRERSSATSTLRVIAAGDDALARIPTDRGLLSSPRPLNNKLLRVWQELSVRAEYAYDYGMPQWLARVDHALGPFHLERLFLGRHKFYHFRIWYRDQLAPFVQQVLLDSLSLARPYVVRRSVERLVQEHVSGKANHTRAIHHLLSAELTQRLLIESQA